MDLKINPQEIITIQGARILFPSHYEMLRSVMPERYQVACDALLMTGMRPVEFERMQPDWYRGPLRIVKLPDGACLKQKCEYKARTVKLSLPGCDAVDKYLHYEGKPAPAPSSSKVAFRDGLRRYADAAGIGTEGITTKMFRKTWCSWLVACFPDRMAYIQASMGHNSDTIAQHYLGLVFPEFEIEEKMRKVYMVGWGGGF